MPQGSVLGPLVFFLYTSEIVSILENMLIGYADDSTLIAVVPSSGVRVTVAESLSPLQLCLVAISWLSVRPMHVVEQLTSC